MELILLMRKKSPNMTQKKRSKQRSSHAEALSDPFYRQRVVESKMRRSKEKKVPKNKLIAEAESEIEFEQAIQEQPDEEQTREEDSWFSMYDPR